MRGYDYFDIKDYVDYFDYYGSKTHSADFAKIKALRVIDDSLEDILKLITTQSKNSSNPTDLNSTHAIIQKFYELFDKYFDLTKLYNKKRLIAVFTKDENGDFKKFGYVNIDNISKIEYIDEKEYCKIYITGDETVYWTSNDTLQYDVTYRNPLKDINSLK